MEREQYDRLYPQLKKLLKGPKADWIPIVLAGRRVGNIDKGIDQYCTGTIPTSGAQTIAKFAFTKGFDRIDIFFNTRKTELQSFNNLIRIEPQIRHLNSNAKVFYHVLSTKNYKDSERLYQYAYDSTQGKFTEYIRQLVSKYEKHDIEYLKRITDVSESFNEVFSSIKGRSLLIFQRDCEAAEALEWCRLHRKKVPDNFSIIGLNNNPRYFHLGITTCVPDWRSIGYLMAHTILRDIPVEKTTRGYIRTRVRMYERMTTP